MSIRDYFRSSKQKQVEKELYDALRKARPRGVELPIEANDPISATLARAAEQLIKDHHELTIVKTMTTLSLYFRNDLDTSVSKTLRDSLVDQGLIKHH